jgi:hypothetical protein
LLYFIPDLAESNAVIIKINNVGCTMNNKYEENETNICPNCGEKVDLFEIDDSFCPSCGKCLSNKKVDLHTDQLSLYDLEPQEEQFLFECNLGKRKRGALKNFIAVLIGMMGGFIVRIVIAIPLFILFATEDGLPDDLALILELFTAFVAGALAACLVPRLGWLFGMLTQFFKLLLMFVIIAIWVYLVATEPDFESFTLGPFHAPPIRIMIFSIVCAAIAGAVAEKYRGKIMYFLSSTFGLIGGGMGCLIYSLFGLFQLYFMYLGGKAIFADGKILKGFAIVLFVGPVISFGIGVILYGFLFGSLWLFSKIYNWYAEDLGLEPIVSDFSDAI